MKRTIAIKLNISDTVKEWFCELEQLFGEACNQVASVAAVEKERNRVKLHHLCYRSLRTSLPKLGAQMCCNAIAKTAAALKAQKHPKRILFKRGCSVHLRISFYVLLREKVNWPAQDCKSHTLYILVPLERGARSLLNEGTYSCEIFF